MAALVIVASLALADKLEKKKQARKDKKAALHDLRVRDLQAEMSESKSGTATTAGTVTGGTATAAAAANGKRRDSVREWWESDDDGEEAGSGAQAQQRSVREEQVRAPPPPLEYEKKGCWRRGWEEDAVAAGLVIGSGREREGGGVEVVMGVMDNDDLYDDNDGMRV
ncbi:hypothetical protein LTR74_010370 [Friedmanniomyces endolithicus]|nr:hypothetical protein LTR74_010370 [Friedmanniomyces endolithicus]